MRFALAAAALLATSTIVWAGPLDPPIGPVAPSFKTLTETEPRIAINATNTPGSAMSVFRIIQSGSYYLTSNLAGVAAKHGIDITASDVTIDLMGFELLGVAGSLDGIHVTGNSNIAISNGAIKNWGEDGVDTSFAIGAVVSKLRVSSSSQVGIRVGSASSVTECTAVSNSNAGILTGDASVVSHCTSQSSGAGGGITVTAGCTISGCSSLANFLGIQTLGVGSTVIDCSSISCSAHGFNLAASTTISRCTATSNGNHGIAAAAGCSITGCTLQSNTQDGINTNNSAIISGNVCDANTASGIHVTGFKNRIEGNNSTRNVRGIDVDVAGNLIIRNSCSANTTLNWDIVANNVFGPILDRTAPASAAVAGNSAASSLGSTDANANFTY